MQLRWLKSLAAVLVVGFCLACTDGMQAITPPTPDPEPVAATESEEEKVARVTKAIAATPDKAELLLKAEGMTAAELEKLLYAIAKDPKRSKAYESALSK